MITNSGRWADFEAFLTAELFFRAIGGY
jgi:hypothetical protein